MGQPAQPAEGGRGEERAARVEAGRRELPVAVGEDPVDAWREAGPLHGRPAVALHEDQQHVLALQPAQQLVTRHGAHRVALRGAANTCSSWIRAGTLATCPSAYDDVLAVASPVPERASSSQTTTSTPTARSVPRRCPLGPAAQLQQREGDQGQQAHDDDGEDDQDHGAEHVAERVVDQTHRRAGVAPVHDHVEGPAQRLPERDVEDLQDREHTEEHADHHEHDGAGAPGEQHADGDQHDQLQRKPGEGRDVHGLEPVGQGQRRPHQHERQHQPDPPDRRPHRRADLWASHSTSRPNDSARRSSAPATATAAGARGSSPDATTVSTTPWIAATTLRQ